MVSRKAEKLLVVLMGSTDYMGRPVSDLVAEHGLSDRVRLTPRCSHQKAIAAMKGADVAVLLGQSGIASMAPVPAKVFEYVGAGKPVMVIGAGEEACEIIRHGGCQLWAANESDIEGIVANLRKILADYGRYREQGQQNWQARQAFTRVRMAEKIEDVLVEAMSAGRKTSLRPEVRNAV